MLLSTLLIGAAVIAGAGLIAAFWSDIRDWMVRALNKVQELVQGVVAGAKILLQKVSEGFKEISRNYSKVGEYWKETTVTRTVPASEVPPEIRAKVVGYEVTDLTDEMEAQLEMA